MCVVYSFVDPSLIMSWCTLFKLLLLSFDKRAKLNLRSTNYFTTTSLIFGSEFLSCNDLLVFNWLLMMMPEMKLWFVDLQLNFSLNRKFIYLASTLRAGFINNRLHLHILYSDLTNKQALGLGLTMHRNSKILVAKYMRKISIQQSSMVMFFYYFAL